VYILVIIELSLWPVTVEDINLVVRVNILDLIAELFLYNVVTYNILYSLYGTYNTFMPYIRNKKYRFQFPYTF